MTDKRRNKLIIIIIVLFFILMSLVILNHYDSITHAQAASAVSDTVSQADVSAAFSNANIRVVDPRIDPRDFNLSLLNGGNVRLSSYKGKVVILNFWATWCPPCVTEMPSMENLYRQYKDRGLEILAVDIMENPNTVRQFIESNGFTFPILLDRNGRVSGQYGVEAIPTTYIIDRNGKIAGMIVGSIYWDTPQVIAAIETLL